LKKKYGTTTAISIKAITMGQQWGSRANVADKPWQPSDRAALVSPRIRAKLMCDQWLANSAAIPQQPTQIDSENSN
jgi:hypothetical protein